MSKITPFISIFQYFSMIKLSRVFFPPLLSWLNDTALIRTSSFCRRPSEREHLESHLNSAGLHRDSNLQRRLSARWSLPLVLQQPFVISARRLRPHNARSRSKWRELHLWGPEPGDQHHNVHNEGRNFRWVDSYIISRHCVTFVWKDCCFLFTVVIILPLSCRSCDAYYCSLQRQPVDDGCFCPVLHVAQLISSHGGSQSSWRASCAPYSQLDAPKR